MGYTQPVPAGLTSEFSVLSRTLKTLTIFKHLRTANASCYGSNQQRQTHISSLTPLFPLLFLLQAMDAKTTP